MNPVAMSVPIVDGAALAIAMPACISILPGVTADALAA
jgi:hypothetical protein